jgi:hypothetical protein
VFDGRSQLIVYHFMLGPGWEAGCPGCSFLSDHIDGALPHLEHHDVTWTAVSRAPLAEIEAYKKRMGWRFPWVSASGTDFNYDYHVSFTKDDLANGNVLYNFTETPVTVGEAGTELQGLSSFYRDDSGGRVGQWRGPGFDDADVSIVPPIIPDSGFSPVRLEGRYIRQCLPVDREFFATCGLQSALRAPRCLNVVSSF